MKQQETGNYCNCLTNSEKKSDQQMIKEKGNFYTCFAIVHG